MLFLLNRTVVTVATTITLPRGLERLTQLTPAGVVNAGCELFQAHPRMETDKPDMAQWFCALVMMKFPQATGALFAQAEGARGIFARVADVPLPELARLYKWQKEGVAVRDDIFAGVWSTSRKLA